MSIIEQAARRIEELRRAGIDVAGTRAVAAQPGFDPGSARPAADMAAPAALGDLGAPRSESAAAGSRRVEIDLARLERGGYIALEKVRSPLADEFRAIKRPLLANVRGESASPVRRANCIMITSSLPGEGKTFTAINLALSLAMEVDSRVLLIDADVIRPAVLTRLGLPDGEKGLLDKLNEPQLQLSELLLRTNVDKLSLLPAGRPDAHATELLASDAMRDMVDELASRYSDRIVVFDSPPLLAAPETSVLASLVGQIVVVVEAQKTLRRSVVEAMSMIENCPVVMTMLNKVTGPTRYSYGYGFPERPRG